MVVRSSFLYVSLFILSSVAMCLVSGVGGMFTSPLQLFSMYNNYLASTTSSMSVCVWYVVCECIELVQYLSCGHIHFIFLLL